MKTVFRIVSFLVAVVVVISALFFWSSMLLPPPTPAKIRVVATLFPLYDFARQVGGERVEVSLLVPSGKDPAAFQPEAKDLLSIEAAGIFIYSGQQMEPWVVAALPKIDHRSLIVVNASTGISALNSVKIISGEGVASGYLWLDLTNAQTMVDNIALALASHDRNGKEYFRQRATEYKMKLAQLDELYRTSLAACRSKKIFDAGYPAFVYLAKRYGLQYFSPYEVPNLNKKQRVDLRAEQVKRLRKAGIKALYFPELVDPKTERTLAREAKLKLLLLNSGRNISQAGLDQGVTFIEIMAGNLERLKIGLEYQGPDSQGGE